MGGLAQSADDERGARSGNAVSVDDGGLLPGCQDRVGQLSCASGLGSRSWRRDGTERVLQPVGHAPKRRPEPVPRSRSRYGRFNRAGAMELADGKPDDTWHRHCDRPVWFGLGHDQVRDHGVARLAALTSALAG